MVRRMLMVLVTGLIVARPFVIGEDPTLSAPLEHLDAATLLLTVLWFVAVVMWAVWRAWSRQGSWYGGALEAALFAVVLLTFAGAAWVAPYKFPAWLMAWEWLGMVAGFFLLRQLAVTREEQHRFFAVFLAGMVVLSVYALYQRGVEFPKIHRQTSDREKFRREREAFAGHPIDSSLLQQEWERAQWNYVYGPYAHPNSFASCLALLFPGVVGAALLCARHKHPRWQVMLASCFATLGFVALGLTVSRGAWLATFLAGLGVIAFIWRDWVRQNWYYALGAVAVLVLIGFGVSQTTLFTTAIGKNQETALYRVKEYWPATWQMIVEHPWFGVGPGNFGGSYPHYMAESAGEVIKDPHNFALEIWATCGIFALLALLIVFVLFYRTTFRFLLSAPTVDGPRDVPPPETKPDEPPKVHWEFYLGGSFGLLLAFVLRVLERSQDEIVTETVIAGVGAVFWFGAFALYEQIRWSNRARVLVLTGGITAMLLTFLIEGGINYPSVAGLLWCAAALALNSTEPSPNSLGSDFKPLLFIPLPVCAAVLALYWLVAFHPVTEIVSLIKRTPAAIEKKRMDAETMVPAGTIHHSYTPLTDEIKALDKAQHDLNLNYDQLYMMLADLEGQQWAKDEGLKQAMHRFDKDDDKMNDHAKAAIKYARDIQKFDPDGRAGYEKEYQLWIMFAESWNDDLQRVLLSNSVPSIPAALGLSGRLAELVANKSKPEYQVYRQKQQEQYRQAAEALKPYVSNKDPKNARLQFDLAVALYRAGRPSEAEPFARRALELADVNNHPTRTLTKEQRTQLEQWRKTRGSS
jgi:O-antigen ligase